MAKKGAVQYTDLIASDVHYGLLELHQDFEKLDSIAQSFAKTITGTKARINVTIKQQTQALNENKVALVGTDVAGKNAADTIQRLSKAAEDNIKKTQALKNQQNNLNQAFNIASASVDEIKARVIALTKEYNSLGQATDQDKAKTKALATEIRSLKSEQDNLTAALNKGKKAVEAAEGSYNQATKKLNDLRKSLRDLPGAINKTTGEWDRANPTIRKYLNAIENLDRGIKKMDATMGQHQRNVGNYGGALNRAGQDITSFLAGFISVASAMTAINASFDKAIEVDAIKTALEFIFRSTGDAAERIQMLKDTAERLGLEFTSLALSYKSFAGAAVASNFPLAEADRLFQSVANASAKLKLSSEQTEGALNALQQMISKGNVQAEELRGQLGERIPGAFAIAARAMGVTEVQLNKMLKDGDVLASELLPKLALELDKTFGNDQTEKIESLQGSFNRLKNTFSQAVDQGNISKFFKVMLDGLTDTISAVNKLTNSSSWKEMFLRLGTVVNSVSIPGLVMNAVTGKKSGQMADAEKERAELAKMTDLERVLANFRKKSQAEQLESIKMYSAAREKALSTAKNSGAQDDIKYANTLTTTLNKLAQTYNALHKSKTVAGESEEDRKKRAAADKKAAAEAEKAARRAELEHRRAVKEADDLLKAQTKIKVAKLDSGLTNDISSATEADKTNILIKYEKEKLVIIEAGISERKKLYTKGTSDYVELEAERVKAVTDSEEAINKAIEDGLKRKKDLEEKYKKLDNELVSVQSDGDQDKAVFDIQNTKFRGNPQEQERQRQDALYNLRKESLTKDLLLVDFRFNHIQDKLEREKEIEIEKARIVNELNLNNYEYQVELNNRAKENLASVFDFLHSNSQIIGDLFGSELGNVFANLTTDLENFLNGGKQGFAEWAEVAVTAINYIASSMSQASEAKITQLESDRERELELAGNNKEAQQKIEDEYNRRVKEEKKKQARANKAAAMIEIAINSAVGASKVIGQTGIFGLPLVPIILGLGAVQIALVAAQPIPEFWKGTDNAPAGWAQIAERGPEIVQDTAGRQRLITNHSLMNMKGGEKVFTAAETSKMLQDMDVHQSSTLHADLSKTVSIGKRNEEIQVMAAALQLSRTDEKKIGEEVGKKIAELPMNINNFDERGYTRSVRKGNTTITLINDKYKLK